MKTQEITNKIKTNHTKPFSLMALSYRSILGLYTWFFLHSHELILYLHGHRQVASTPWSYYSNYYIEYPIPLLRLTIVLGI